jgi:putative tryptophan/tyrosine transport system substrate-binding protein
MNQRRLLMLALGASLSGHVAVLRAQTSSAGMRRVGVLAPSTQAKEEFKLKPFFDHMHELGWVEGQNIVYDRAYADDQMAMLLKIAAELVARKPDLIYAPPTPAAVAAKRATQTIPIVFGAVNDPVGTGLVTSLARPGGNVTGMTTSVAESLAPKRVQLLREILPGMKRIGLLGDSTDSSSKLDQQALAPVAASLGVTIILAEAANPPEAEAAVARLITDRVEATNQRRVPIVGVTAQYADAGALFNYGASLNDRLRRSAMLVDKILKGAKPADLPVEQPTLFEFVVNLKTAKALGITVPRAIRLRADAVIE